MNEDRPAEFGPGFKMVGRLVFTMLQFIHCMRTRGTYRLGGFLNILFLYLCFSDALWIALAPIKYEMAAKDSSSCVIREFCESRFPRL